MLKKTKFMNSPLIFRQTIKNLTLSMLFLPLLLIITACNNSSISNKTYKIGYMICNSSKETEERFLVLNKYLEKETGYRFKFYAVDTVDFEEAFKKEQFDFIHTNPVLYIILKENYGLIPIVAEKNGIHGARTFGTIIVRKDSPIKDIKDLKNKKMIFGPTFAPFGYITQLYLLMKNGIDPYKDLSIVYQPKHSFQHEKIIYGVWFGAFDAGTAPFLDLEEMDKEGKIKLEEDFRIIAKSDLLPYCTYSANKNLSAEVIDKVKKALLKLNKDTTVEINNQKLNIFKQAKIEGYEPIEDKDYDKMREILKYINFPPYQKY
jgi:phosphate/phosphite/phosphonate ABC transporter binding protein